MTGPPRFIFVIASQKCTASETAHVALHVALQVLY